MADEAALRARLESNYAAFEGILSLTPAKYYYGEDNDDQWQRKKQTKAEKRAAKKAKLDPESYKSALDVHREKELKRKREIEDGDEAVDTIASPTISTDNVPTTTPRPSKKPKVDKKDAAADKTLTPEEDAAIKNEKNEKRRAARERKLKRKHAARDAKEAKKAASSAKVKPAKTTHDADASGVDGGEHSDEESDEAEPKVVSKPLKPKFAAETSTSKVDVDDEELDGAEKIELNGFEDDGESESDASSETSTPAIDTPTFDHSAEHSASSSTSSIVPPSEPPKSTSVAIIPAEISQTATSKPAETLPLLPDTESTRPGSASPSGSSGSRQRAPKLPMIDSELLKQRLDARLAALRAARKADGPDGKPARNRQELIDARRQKQEKRKQHKKELRAQARKDDNEAEAEAARLRGGSGSPLWTTPSLLSPREPQNNFSFGRVAFEDGAELDSNLTGTIDPRKKKGAQDPKTALEAARNKQQRLSGLDETKRKDIEEKDRWLNAKKRVQGEKVRDNTSLLKKTLKRQEKGKKRSEKEWNERIDGVVKGKEMKQKRREDNLAKRREEKGTKKGKGKVVSKPKRRPGFEGSLKIGTKRGP